MPKSPPTRARYGGRSSLPDRRGGIHHSAATRTKREGAVNGAPVRVTTTFSLMPAGVATWPKVAAVSSVQLFVVREVEVRIL